MERRREKYPQMTDEQFEDLECTYPIGEECEIDDNVCECATWYPGEPRCECGNRRIQLTICADGSFYTEGV